MAGLLYKDFVSLKGKIYVAVVLAVLVLAMVLRILLPPSYIDELLWALSVLIIFLLYLLVVEKIEISLIAADEGRKQKQYFLSLPISRRQYVASKYLFLLLTFFVLLSVSELLQTICMINCRNEEIMEAIPVFESVLLSLSCAFLLIPAIELPFFVGFGADRGNQIKTGLLMVLLFLVILYLFFGDLTIIDRINFIEMLNYLNANKGVFLCLQTFAPYGVFLLYYLSYRVSCRLFEKRGVEK